MAIHNGGNGDISRFRAPRSDVEINKRDVVDVNPVETPPRQQFSPEAVRLELERRRGNLVESLEKILHVPDISDRAPEKGSLAARPEIGAEIEKLKLNESDAQAIRESIQVLDLYNEALSKDAIASLRERTQEKLNDLATVEADILIRLGRIVATQITAQSERMTQRPAAKTAESQTVASAEQPPIPGGAADITETESRMAGTLARFLSGFRNQTGTKSLSQDVQKILLAAGVKSYDAKDTVHATAALNDLRARGLVPEADEMADGLGKWYLQTVKAHIDGEIRPEPLLRVVSSGTSDGGMKKTEMPRSGGADLASLRAHLKDMEEQVGKRPGLYPYAAEMQDDQDKAGWNTAESPPSPPPDAASAPASEGKDPVHERLAALESGVSGPARTAEEGGAAWDPMFADTGSRRSASAGAASTGDPTRRRGVLGAAMKGVEAVGAAGLAGAEAIARSAQKIQQGRHRLAEKGGQLKSKYRQKLEERARPGGDRVMAEQPVRIEALVAATRNPESGWTDDDTQNHILALGIRKLELDAKLNPFAAREILEMPKDLRAVFKRGNKIIMDYIDRKNARDRERTKEEQQRQRSNELEATLSTDERARLQARVTDGTFDEDDRALYLKIRSRKRPYPITPKEWGIFGKVWGISDVVRRAGRQSIRTGAKVPEAAPKKSKLKRGELLIPTGPETGKTELTPEEINLLREFVRTKKVSSTDVDAFVDMWQRPANKGSPQDASEKKVFDAANKLLEPQRRWALRQTGKK